MNKTITYLLSIVFILVVGYVVYLSTELNSLKYKQEQDKINMIAKKDSSDNVQDSINTAHQKAIIELIQNHKKEFIQQDSVSNNKRKKLNDEINNLHISYDSLPNF